MAGRGTGMRIDSHHHLWDLAVRDQPWTAGLEVLARSYSFDDLEPALTAAGIDATILVQTVPQAAETPELLALAAEQTRVAGVVGWIDLTGQDAASTLAELRSGTGGAGLVGIRHGVQDEADPRWLCRPDVRAGILAVGEAGLVYDLLITASQLPAAIETVQSLPSVRFVLDHAAKPDIANGAIRPWDSSIVALAALPNVVVKLSGLVTEAGDDWTVGALAPYVDTLLAAFGPSRIMFGSDWPVCLLVASYGDVVQAAEDLTADLTGDERAQIFGLTAERWYSIDR